MTFFTFLLTLLILRYRMRAIKSITRREHRLRCSRLCYTLFSCSACCFAFHAAYSRCPSSLSKNACISGSRTRAMAAMLLRKATLFRPSPIYGRDGPLTSELRDTRPETQNASRPVPVNIYRNRAGSVLTHTAPCRRRWNAREHFAAGPRCEKSCYSSYRSTIRARISETHPSGSFSTSFSQK